MKEIERILLISFIISSLALTLSIVCIPLLHFNLEDLTALVHKDMEYFKNTTDFLWRDLVILEGPTPRDKRDDPGPYVYRYKPTLKDKIKQIRTPFFHLHYNIRRSEPKNETVKRIYYSSNSTLFHRRRHPKWGRKIFMGIKGTYPKGRALAAPTVEVKDRPGKQLFTDSEYIGSLVPMGQKEDDDSSPTVVQPRCQMKLIPNPKCPQGAPGVPGEDGENGSDGLPGLSGKDGEAGMNSYQHEESCIQCPVGEPGIKGPPGPPGDLGSPGPRGRNGILTEKVGPRGPTGPPGDEGEKGIPGPRGQMGVSVKKWICPPGDKGLPGPKGPRGSAGPPGDQGENGIQGVRGRRGPRGPAGQQGVPGPMGAEGPQGRLGFEEHYCECPARSKGVRGRFELPVIGAYVSKEDENYPRNIFLHK